MPEFNQLAGAGSSGSTVGNTRQIAFGYSTKCNIKCEHCVAADESPRNVKMELSIARELIEDLKAAARANGNGNGRGQNNGNGPPDEPGSRGNGGDRGNSGQAPGQQP